MIVSLTEYHLCPSRFSDDSSRVLTLVHIADGLEKYVQPDGNSSNDVAFDMDYLEPRQFTDIVNMQLANFESGQALSA